MKLQEIFTLEFSNNLKNYFWIKGKSIFSDEIAQSFGILCFDVFYWKIDHYMEFELLWNYDIVWYQNKIKQVIDDNVIWYLSELMNWITKGKLFTQASLNDINNFCSSITKTTTTPFDQAEGQDPIWNTQTNTTRNYLLLDAPQLKWIRFDGLKKMIKEISFLLKTIL